MAATQEFQQRIGQEVLSDESSLTVLAPGLGVARLLASLAEYAFVAANSMRRPCTFILGATDSQIRRAKSEIERKGVLPDDYSVPEVCYIPLSHVLRGIRKIDRGRSERYVVRRADNEC